MKTTLELDDDLYARVKQMAAGRRTTVRRLVEESLRAHLFAPVPRRKQRRVKWVTVAGGGPPGLDLRNRAAMHEWVRRNP